MHVTGRSRRLNSTASFYKSQMLWVGAISIIREKRYEYSSVELFERKILAAAMRFSSGRTYEHFQPIIHNTTTVVYNPLQGIYVWV
jgi:hypothetical protein